MPPRDAPQFPEMLAMVKALRCDTKACAGVPFSKLALRPKGDGTELLALGTLGGANQTLLVGDVTEKGCTLNRAIEPLTVKKLLNCMRISNEDEEREQAYTLTPEAILQAERQRSSVVGGVSHLSMAKSGVVYMATAEKTIRMDQRGSFTTTKIRKTVLDVMVCPSDSHVAAVTADQSLMIIKAGEIIFESTNENKDISNGIPPFIIQEEMERFNGMWWSPSHSLLLYERVNEEKVQRVLVSTRQPPMKYPLAGTKNARSTLRMIHVGSKVHDYGLKVDLHKRYTWMEYITRAGFMGDGTTVWVEMMDREQRRSSIALIPLSEFEGIDRSPDTVVQEATLAYTEKCACWINTHNLTSSCNLPTSLWSLIHGVTGDFATKLILITPKTTQVITTDEFNVHKNGGVFVDSDKQLVYFFAHRSTPMEVHFCVASLSHPTQVEQLTEDEVSCRVDRSARTAAISFNSCFVVWLSSLRLPPHCVVYSLSHGREGSLPSATRLCQVQVEVVSSPSALLSPRPDSPRILSYFSPTSGRSHHAIVHTPNGKGPFPVIHFVYGGPGVQLVRNEWSAWTFLQKYAALGFAAVVIDGRGSDGRGKKWEGVIKNKLGEVELKDQVEGLHIISNMLGTGVLDMKRVAVHGWSYGGYMSVLALARHPELYRAAVAGGTVVDWAMYDTAYTERYLGLEVPSYASSNLEKVVKLLPDTPGKLMLAHGLQDENVHFRHAELLIELLIKNGKPYNLQLFPSERHGLRHVDASSHFDASMFSFISAAFRSPPFPTSTPVEL